LGDYYARSLRYTDDKKLHIKGKRAKQGVPNGNREEIRAC
jgi:hypothetical protein